MNWFYALNNEQKGPVSEEELAALANQGLIDAETLVWKDGMPDWQRYGTALAAQPVATAAPPSIPTGAGILCSECGRGFRPDEVVKVADRWVCAGCKPVLLQKFKEGTVYSGAAEQIRREHIAHEASIKSIGFLYLIGTPFGAIGGAMSLIVGLSSGEPEGLFVGAVGGAILVLSIAGFATGLGLRRLKSWSRVSGGILCTLGLFALGLGTLINAYALYLLFSKKGATVFSEDYRRVVAETPHIKYRTPIYVWIVLAVLVGAIAFGLFAVGLKR